MTTEQQKGEFFKELNQYKFNISLEHANKFLQALCNILIKGTDFICTFQCHFLYFHIFKFNEGMMYLYIKKFPNPIFSCY